MVCDIDFIVINENILRSVNDIPIVTTGSIVIPKNVIPVFCGSAPYILLELLLGKRMLIVIPGISLNGISLNRGSTVCTAC